MNTMIEARHWEDVDLKTWRWPHFPPQELACRGTGRLKISIKLLDMLEALRAKLGDKPMLVRSAYRTPEHNTKVGGAPNSLHIQGTACDISMANHDPMEFEVAARAVGFTGFGFYSEPRNNFIHVDLGPAREWGTRWPVGERLYTPERPVSPVKDPEVKSAAAQTAGGAGVVGALEGLKLGLEPYAGTFAWVQYGVIAITVGLATWTIYRMVRS